MGAQLSFITRDNAPRQSHFPLPYHLSIPNLLSLVALALLTSVAWGDSVPSSAGGDLCGTTEDRLRAALDKHDTWELTGSQALPTTQSFDIGEIAVLEDDGTLLHPAGPDLVIDPIAVSRMFFKTHGDDYDFLCMYVATEVPFAVIPGSSAFAYALNVVQEVQGIGLGLWDFSADFGSSGRLRSFLNLNTLFRYPADPHQNIVVTNSGLDILAHEAGHRWCAYVRNDSLGTTTDAFLGSGNAHWNFFFSNQASMLGGNEWTQNPDSSFTSTAATQRYGDLELYLMGYLAADSVGSLPVLYDHLNCTPPGTYGKTHHALDGVTCDARQHDFQIADIVTTNGPRQPDVTTSPKNHRFAFVLIIPNGSTAEANDLIKINTLRTSWETYYAQLTGGRGTADITLDSTTGEVAISHSGRRDSENTATPYTIQAEISLQGASLPHTIDPSSVTLHYGIDGGALTPVAMSAGGADTFEAAIPAQGNGSTVRYAISATSDSSSVEGWWPGPNSTDTHLFQVGPDLTPPSGALESVPLQITTASGARLHVVTNDNLGVGRVVGTYRINGGAPDSLDLSRIADSDTFYLDISALGIIGDQLELGARAVDSSAAQNANPVLACGGGSCLFTFGIDWYEQLDYSDGGFVTSAITGGSGNAWHWTDQDDCTARAAWKCGDPGSLNYLAGLDAGIVTPPLSITQNATLRFRHRYDLETLSTGEAWDGAILELSLGGGPWQQLTPDGGYPTALFEFSGTALAPGTPVYSGRSAGWDVQSFEEAVFTLSALDSVTAQFRWRMVSDGYVGGGGWFVDDIQLTMDLPGVSIADSRGPQALRFRVPEPNPTRGMIRFAAQVNEASELKLEIFDVRGRRVGLPFAGRVAAGPWDLAWNTQGGSSVDGSPPATLRPGVYLARMILTSRQGVSKSLSRRFVVLR